MGSISRVILFGTESLDGSILIMAHLEHAPREMLTQKNYSREMSMQPTRRNTQEHGLQHA